MYAPREPHPKPSPHRSWPEVVLTHATGFLFQPHRIPLSRLWSRPGVAKFREPLLPGLPELRFFPQASVPPLRPLRLAAERPRRQNSCKRWRERERPDSGARKPPEVRSGSLVPLLSAAAAKAGDEGRLCPAYSTAASGTRSSSELAASPSPNLNANGTEVTLAGFVAMAAL